MSELFRWYLGGLMATAREFSLLFAPTVNSYKRFQPGSWAPTGDRLGRRQPHARLPRRRPRSTACASRAASRAPTPTPTTPSPPRSPAACYGIEQRDRADRRRTAATATRPTDLTAHPVDVRRGDRALARQRDRRRVLRRRRPPPRAACTPSPSGRRSTRPSPTGSAPATSSGSDGVPCSATARCCVRSRTATRSSRPSSAWPPAIRHGRRRARASGCRPSASSPSSSTSAG